MLGGGREKGLAQTGGPSIARVKNYQSVVSVHLCDWFRFLDTAALRVAPFSSLQIKKRCSLDPTKILQISPNPDPL